MDNQSALNNQQEKKPHPLNILAFFEIGLLEVVLVAIGVFLLLATANYFNLLPVSRVFPRYLGWLPRREVSDDILKQRIKDNNIYDAFLKQYYGSRKKPTPTPTPPLTAVFVDNTLKPYLSSVVGSDVFYSISDILQLQGKNKLDSDIVINLETTKGTASGILQLSKDKDNLSLINLLFSRKNTASPNPAPLNTIRKEVSNLFAVSPKGTWNCKTVNNVYSNIEFCENFWEEENGVKQGLYYQDPVSVDYRTKEKTVNFGFCEYRQDSNRFLWKSCFSAFKETGLSL